MAFFPSHAPRVSLLELIAKRLKQATMNDWIKMLGSAVVAVAVAWSMLQQHDYRLNKLEASFEEHLDKHDEQNTTMLKTLTQIQIDVSRLSAKAEEALRR
jgi:hypothetical protein